MRRHQHVCLLPVAFEHRDFCVADHIRLQIPRIDALREIDAGGVGSKFVPVPAGNILQLITERFEPLPVDAGDAPRAVHAV